MLLEYARSGAKTASDLDAAIRHGIEAIENGETMRGLMHFEFAGEIRSRPDVLSYLAYCIAKERRQVREAIAMCREALETEPGNAVHYLNLGRVLLLAGRKEQAIEVFRQGMKLGSKRRISAELKRLGLRKPALVHSLPREHPLNKYLGLFLTRLRLR